MLYDRRNLAAPFLIEVSRDLTGRGIATCAVPAHTVDIAPHLLGYLDGEGRGVAGLERAYDALLTAMLDDLKARYPREQVESILMHEVVHWLRLMPYKLAKDRKRAPMFYAGLVMVANDVADFVQGEGKLC